MKIQNFSMEENPKVIHQSASFMMAVVVRNQIEHAGIPAQIQYNNGFPCVVVDAFRANEALQLLMPGQFRGEIYFYQG